MAAEPPQPADRPDDLSEREVEVLRMIALGHTNAEIAEQLFLSDTTVKTHVTRLLQKLELRDRAQAIVLAYETRLFEPDETRSPDGPAARG